MSFLKSKKIILPVFLFIFIIIGLASWQYIIRTPQYSIFQMYRAVSKHDYERFSKYVDVEGVVDKLVDKAIDEAFAETEEETKSEDSWYQMGYELGASLAEGLIMSWKPKLKEELVKQFREEVEKGSFRDDYKPANISEAYKFAQVEREGKVARVTLTKEGEEMKLMMRSVDNYWQIFEMDFPLPETNLGEEISESESTAEVRFGERVDITLGWFLTIEKTELYNPSSTWDLPKEGFKFVTVKVTYENTTEQTDYLSIDNLKLKDTENFSYSYYYSGREPEIESGDLESNGIVTGYVTFEIPTTSEPLSVVYSGTRSLIFKE